MSDDLIKAIIWPDTSSEEQSERGIQEVQVTQTQELEQELDQLAADDKLCTSRSMSRSRSRSEASQSQTLCCSVSIFSSYAINYITNKHKLQCV